MANGGWYGTKEEWERIENPLINLDSIMDDFANDISLNVTKNYKDWPERSIAWGDNVRCLIQIYLVDDKKLTFNLWLCASQDRGLKRYWKNEFLVKEKTVDEFRDNLALLLREGFEKLTAWSDDTEQLEFATNIEPLK
jgi:hypothetical protein